MSNKFALRGGSWIYEARDCRCASRLGRGSGHHYLDLGFRIIQKPIEHSTNIRAVRGGSFDENAGNCHSAWRNWELLDFRHYYLGFRIIQKTNT